MNPIYVLLHKLDYCLQKELKNCQTVLDLGCGPSSPLKNIKHLKFSLGVEAFKPYLDISKKNKIHTKYLEENILNVNFPDNSFDAVILIEVIEHLSKKDGQKIIKKAFKWAKKKVILSTPNNYFQMGQVDQNPYQQHRSGWSITELKNLGFKVNGVSGLKMFYQEENHIDSLITNKPYQNIKFKPKIFFYFINAFCQIFNYYYPRFSFGLFAVNEKHETNQN